ncbi:cytochrome ubiquinol oxidase subunit I, partial [Streptomyces sp. NPDC057621]
MDEAQRQQSEAAPTRDAAPSADAAPVGSAGSDDPGRAGGSSRTPARPTWVEWLTTTDHKRIGTLYL